MIKILDQRLVMIVGVVTSIIGLLTIYGWRAHPDFLLAINHPYIPMRFSSAICFFILGMAMTASGLGKTTLAKALSVSVIVISLIILTQYIFKLNLGLDELLLGNYWHLSNMEKALPAAATAFSFVLCSSLIIMVSKEKPRKFAITLLSIVILGQALGVIVGYLAGLSTFYSAQNYTGMAFHSAVLFVLIALAHLYIFRQTNGARHYRGLAILVALGTFTSILIIWQALKTQESEDLKRLLKTHAFSMHEEAEKALYELSTAQGRMAKRWIAHHGTLYPEWRLDAEEYIHDMRDIRQIEWIDKTQHLRWIVPSLGNEKLLGIPVLVSNASGEASQEDSIKALSESDHHYFYITAPVFAHGESDGYLRTVFDVNSFLHSIIKRQLALGYEAQIMNGSEVIFSNRKDISQQDFGIEQPIDYLNFHWTLYLYPSKTLTQSTLGKLSTLILIGGSLLALMLAILSDLYLRSRQQQGKLAQQNIALLQGEEKIRSLLDSIEDGVFVAQNYCFVFTNESFPELLGYQDQEMIGLSFTKVIAPDYLAIWTERFEKRIQASEDSGKEEPIRRYSVQFLKKGGQEVIWVELYARRYIYENQPAVLGIVRDMTERRAIEEQVRFYQQRLELVAQGAVDCLWDWDIVNNTLYFSERWDELLGYQLGELSHNFDIWKSHLHPNDQSRVLAELNAHLEQQAPYNTEYRLLKKNGEFCWVQASGQAIWNEGQAIRMAGSLSDITPRKLMEEQLRATIDFEAAILNSTNLSIIATDPQGMITAFNTAAEKMLGYSAQEMVGYHTPEILHEPAEVVEYAALLSKELGRIITPGFEVFVVKTRGGFADEREWTYIRKDGSRFPVLLSATAIFDATNGHITGYLGIATDISERKEQTRVIKSALQEKETLLKEVYHRVKNNLQVIQSLLNIQGRALPEGNARTAINETSARIRAMALVHEKLYQSGNLSEVKLSEYVNDLLKQLLETWGAKRRGIEFVQNIESIEIGLDVAIPLGLLINELVSNCLKHAFPEGRSGQIEVNFVSKLDKKTLSVSDDGIGLPANVIARLDSTLGLKLASTLANQLGGKLEFSNSSRRGATFSIEFSL